MQVRSYKNEPKQSASPPMPCAGCYPILYQVWFGTGWEYDDEPHSLDFNFTDNELRQIHLEHEAKMEEEIDILNALMTCQNYMSGKVLFCE